jgi:hypothetical protein
MAPQGIEPCVRIDPESLPEASKSSAVFQYQSLISDITGQISCIGSVCRDGSSYLVDPRHNIAPNGSFFSTHRYYGVRIGIARSRSRIIGFLILVERDGKWRTIPYLSEKATTADWSQLLAVGSRYLSYDLCRIALEHRPANCPK